MSEDNNDKWAHLTPVQQEKAQKAVEKQELSRKLKEISGNSKWTITQSLLQEVIATYISADPNKPLPSTPVLIEQLKLAIKENYPDNLEMQEFLIDTIPSVPSVNNWIKKEGWNEAVWNKLRDTGLFTRERRAAMINALYQRGVEKDTVAAKIWLQMSGDFVEKSEVTNKDNTIDKFREINNILHNSKKKEN